MNTAVTLVLNDAGQDRQKTLARLQKALEDLESVEQRFSRFRADSELSALNRSPQTSVKVSPAMYEVLSIATKAAGATDGLFNPAILSDLERAGYAMSFELLEQPGVGHESRSVPEPPTGGFADFQLEAGEIVNRPPGTRIDLGGIVKGWSTDRQVERLAAYGDVLVDMGGDVAVRSQGKPWAIPVTHSRKTIAVVGLKSGGVATSSTRKRRWRKDSRWQHHIIDPRSGSPSETDVAAATVVAPTAVEAEVWAKVACLLGTVKALRLFEDRPEIEAIVVSNSGTVQWSRGMTDYLVETSDIEGM